jgi:hypothetical protein
MQYPMKEEGLRRKCRELTAISCNPFEKREIRSRGSRYGSVVYSIGIAKF